MNIHESRPNIIVVFTFLSCSETLVLELCAAFGPIPITIHKPTIQSDVDMQYQSIPRATNVLNHHRQSYVNDTTKGLGW